MDHMPTKGTTYKNFYDHNIKDSYCVLWMQDLSISWLNCDPEIFFNMEYYSFPKWIPEGGGEFLAYEKLK